MMLDGIRVVELGTTITAPYAAMLLADLGADVVKVERADVPFAPINSVAEALAAPQVAALGTAYTIDTGRSGSLTALHNPVVVDGARITPRRAPPTLGARAPASTEYAP